MDTTKALRTGKKRSVPVLGDQRPPSPTDRSGPPPPRSALRSTSKAATTASLVQALGWLSIGLGIIELLAPRQVARGIGSRGHDRFARLCGLRELACGVGLLTSRRSEKWLWARVAGDAMDLALLGSAMSDPRNDRVRTVAATAAVLGVTAVDVLAARRVRGQAAPDAASPVDPETFVERTLAVNRPPQACYDLWRDLESLPRFMKHVESVTVTGPDRSHWVAKAPAGARVEWDSEITNDQPGRLIAWRSLDEGDVDHAGVVRFDPDPSGRGTIVRVEMHYAPPAGRLGAAIAALFGEEPSQSIQEDLRRFKRLLETGEIPTTEGQSHGRRSMLYRLLRKGHQR